MCCIPRIHQWFEHIRLEQDLDRYRRRERWLLRGLVPRRYLCGYPTDEGEEG